MSNNNQLKNVTVTVIFDGAALNRDEKIGGNILSVKKLNVNGEERSFISKPAIRHYLFETLHKAFGWEPAGVLKSSDVAQFDLFRKDVLTSKELDAFGYMYTISGQNSLTRKSPVGITKAISLSSFEQDMAFYGNHDLVARANKEGYKISPDPYNKEEHNSFYKLSFTIDVERLGTDEWVVKNCYSKEKKGILEIEIETPQKQEINNIAKGEEGEFFKLDDHIIYKEGVNIKIPSKLVKEDSEKGTIKLKKVDNRISPNKNFKVDDYEKETILIDDKEIEYYTFHLNEEPIFNNDKKSLTLRSGAVKEIVFSFEEEKNETMIYKTSDNDLIKVRKVKNGPYIVKFEICKEKKEKRIKQLLQAINDGLYAQSSGEANTITPLFIMAAPVRIPSPVFHSYLDISFEDGKPNLIGVKDGLANSWIDGRVFIKDTERLQLDRGKLDANKYYDDWNSFLNEVGINNSNNE